MTTQALEKPKRRLKQPIRNGRTWADVEHALQTLAVCGNNACEAARRLAQQGQPIPRRTIEHWKIRYSDKFAEIQQTHAVEIGKVVAAKNIELAFKQQKVEALAVEKTREQLEAGEFKDASTVVRNLAVARKVNTDGALQLEGRPTSIVEHRKDVVDILDTLTEKAPSLIVDGTAEEIE